MQQIDIFLKLMNTLQRRGVLKEIFLIGSWCLYFYKEYFNNSHHVPIIRTLDIDFLIPNPPKITQDINLNLLLIDLGFEEKSDYLSGLSKYSHEDLEVEFLFPEQGKGKSEPYKINKLHINAIGLRYLNLLQDHITIMSRDNITVKLPEPAAFVLHKYVISHRRNKIMKRKKDLETAIELGSYLLSIEDQRDKLFSIFKSMPNKWQKNLLSILTNTHQDMYDFLST